jgi:hypothetical protein
MQQKQVLMDGYTVHKTCQVFMSSFQRMNIVGVLVLRGKGGNLKAVLVGLIH